MVSLGKVLTVGTTALLLTACGSSGSTTATTSATASTTAKGAGFRSIKPPAAAGVVASINAPQMQVQGTQTGETTVTWSSSTRFSITTRTTVSALSVGECVTVLGSASSSGTALTAVDVTVAKSASNCSAPAGTPTHRRKSKGARTGGRTKGSTRAVRGIIKALGNNSIQLTTVPKGLKTAKVVDIGTTPSTVVLTTGVGSPTSLSVGQCVVVRGAVNTIGTVSAKSVLISPSVNGTCKTRLRGSGSGG